MTQPLALVVYEKLLPGSQLVNRLQDLGYRVQVVENPDSLKGTAQETGPIVVFADIRSESVDVLGIIRGLKSHASTGHLPVVAFGVDESDSAAKAASEAGVTLIASETMLANYLPQVLDQALRID